MKVETLVKVDFYGDPVLAYQDEDGKVWVAAKQIATNLGLDWMGQYRKLKNHEVLREGIDIRPIPSPGGKQEMLLIDLDYLPYWLATISPSKVSPSIREKLIRYQKEVVKVLRDYFFKGAVINPRVPGEKTGREPRKSTTIINGKEVLTNYYTNEDLPLMEEAFAVWALNGQKNAQPVQQQRGRAITSRTLFKHNGRRIGG